MGRYLMRSPFVSLSLSIRKTRCLHWLEYTLAVRTVNPYTYTHCILEALVGDSGQRYLLPLWLIHPEHLS